MRLGISEHEFSQRRLEFYDRMAKKQISAACLLRPTEVFYLHFISTERPIALVMNAEDEMMLFLVPRLEHEHAEHNANLTEVR